MKHLLIALLSLLLITACKAEEKTSIRTTIQLPDAVNGQAYYTEVELPGIWSSTDPIQVFPNRYAHIKLIAPSKVAISHEANFNQEELASNIYLILGTHYGGGSAFQRYEVTLALEVHKPTARILKTCQADSQRTGTTFYHCDFYHQAMDKGAKQQVDCYQHPDVCGLQDYIRPYWMENGSLKGEKDL